MLQMCDVHYSGHGVFCLCKRNIFEALAHVQNACTKLSLFLFALSVKAVLQSI